MKIMTTQWTESKLSGDATLRELLEYLRISDDVLMEIGKGYGRMAKLMEMVRQMNVNRSDKLKNKES